MIVKQLYWGEPERAPHKRYSCVQIVYIYYYIAYIVAINCWHTWIRIDTTWRGLSGRYMATMTHGLLGSVSMVFTIYGSFGLIYSSQLLRLAPNRPCMSLVLLYRAMKHLSFLALALGTAMGLLYFVHHGGPIVLFMYGFAWCVSVLALIPW